MLRCCAVVEELLIIRHQVVRNSRRFMYMCFVICILRLIMLRCCATVEILPIIHHQVARYSRHYGSGTLNMYPSVQCTTNYILLKCHNQMFELSRLHSVFSSKPQQQAVVKLHGVFSSHQVSPDRSPEILIFSLRNVLLI